MNPPFSEERKILGEQALRIYLQDHVRESCEKPTGWGLRARFSVSMECLFPQSGPTSGMALAPIAFAILCRPLLQNIAIAMCTVVMCLLGQSALRAVHICVDRSGTPMIHPAFRHA